MQKTQHRLRRRRRNQCGEKTFPSSPSSASLWLCKKCPMLYLGGRRRGGQELDAFLLLLFSSSSSSTAAEIVVSRFPKEWLAGWLHIREGGETGILHSLLN